MTTVDRQFGIELMERMDSLGIYGPDAPVIFGSAVMKLHGLKPTIGDVDLFVDARTYRRLRLTWQELRPFDDDPPFLEAACADGLEFHAFFTWTTRDRWLDVPEAVATAEPVGGLLCVKLELVARWKLAAISTCIDNGVRIDGSPWEKHVYDLQTLYDAGVRP